MSTILRWAIGLMATGQLMMPASAQDVGWGRKASRHIYAHVVNRTPDDWPSDPRRPAAVRFLVDDRGRITDATVAQSSGVPVFDRAALAAVRAASPLPRPPGLKPGETMRVVQPIRFNTRPHRGRPPRQRPSRSA